MHIPSFSKILEIEQIQTPRQSKYKDYLPFVYLWIVLSGLICIKLGTVHCTYLGVSGYDFKNILHSFV